MQGTADLYHEIADAVLPQAAPVFHNATTLDAAVDMLDPQPTLVEHLIGPCSSNDSSWPRGFFVGMRIVTSGSVNARKPRSCKSWLPAGKGYGVASAIGLSCVWPPSVSLRKRMRSKALTSRTFLTVWSLFLPL